MINSRKKGFTLVELVIVIAVVAILVAVLIPTFSSLINKANMSSDQVAVRDMNTILALEKVENDNMDFEKVKEILKEAGFRAENYRPLTDGATFYWIENLKIIVLADENDKIIYPTNIDEDVQYNEQEGTKWYSLIAISEEINSPECEHKIEKLTNVDWKRDNTGTPMKPTCVVEGYKVGYCEECEENVEITVEPTGHISRVDLGECTLNGQEYESISYESSCCQICKLPIAFVEEIDDFFAYETADEYYEAEAIYCFTGFSTKKIRGVLKGETEEKELLYSVNELVYGDYFDKIKNIFRLAAGQNISVDITEFEEKLFGMTITRDNGNQIVTDFGSLKYLNQGAAFTMAFSSDVQAECCFIGGAHGTSGPFGFKFPSKNLSKYEEAGVLGDIKIPYVNILETFKFFYCAFANINIKSSSNMTVLVNLVIEDLDMEGQMNLISSIKHYVKPSPEEAKNAIETYLNNNPEGKNGFYLISAGEGEANKKYCYNNDNFGSKEAFENEGLGTFNPDGTITYGEITLVSTGNPVYKDGVITIYEYIIKK